MYRSKGRTLELFSSEDGQREFKRLYSVVRDVLTLPEYVQHAFGETLRGKRFGGLRAVRTLKHGWTRPGTTFETHHVMDMAASLPLAAAFRECLDLRGGVYKWRCTPAEVFPYCADDLYRLLVSKSRVARSMNALAADGEYWSGAVAIVLRAKDEALTQRGRKVS
jgi:hypothetical protein